MNYPKNMIVLLSALVLTTLLSSCSNVDDLKQEEIDKQIKPSMEITASVPTIKPEVEKPVPDDPITTLLSQMTTEEKIGQLLIQDFRGGDTPLTELTELTEHVRTQISDYHLGGVVLFSENLSTVEQTKSLIADMQASAEIPLIIGVDEEGGTVSRLNFSDIPHERIPVAGTIPSNEEAYRTANVTGETLRSLGINVDFAPVADVNTNPNNPVIGTRAYSSDAETAAERVTAAIQGFHDADIGTAAKHFPGHGDTNTDPHFGTASVNHDLERLQTVEFLPFQAAVDAEVGMIMVGHIGVPNVTGNDIPASLNPAIVSLIRSELDFDGVIITDAMNMGAIVDNFGVGESAVQALEAGVDILLMPSSLEEAYQSIQDAVAEGRITQSQLDDSVTRILQMKFDLNILES